MKRGPVLPPPTPEQIAEHIAAWGEPEDSTWTCPQGHQHKSSKAALAHGAVVGVHHSPEWLHHVSEAWAMWHAPTEGSEGGQV